MKVEWINPFIGAAEDIFASYGLNFGVGRPSVQGTPILGNNLNVAIGITGDIKGTVILSLGTEDALAIAKNIIPWELTELDDMSISSISELTNILAGRASTNFEQMGIKTDLSVPSVITGTSIKVYSTGLQNIIIPFNIWEGDSDGKYSGFLSVSLEPN